HLYTLLILRSSILASAKTVLFVNYFYWTGALAPLRQPIILHIDEMQLAKISYELFGKII
ncbi:hypothetical protein, partial [Nostoc sp.]|uniref:hypothetical protein n=1 Tax=Nostoc sp. TaxID=1180 RepID=UPI002FF95FE8